MIMDLQPRKSPPIGTIILFALTFVLFAMMLANVSFSSGGGEASFSQAIASFLSVIGLWISLSLLLAVAPLWVKCHAGLP